MSVHLMREIDSLRKKILSLGALVEENYNMAIGTLSSPDSGIVARIAARDSEIDRMEVEIEEDCLKVLALHQPVAADLRYLVCVLKLNNDLERIGDQALNLARKTLHFKENSVVNGISDLTAMAHQTREMLRSALDALVNMDNDLASEVRSKDDDIDNQKKNVRRKMEAAIQHDPANCESYLAALGAARNIERIADLVTNICEDVIYSASGRIVRHGL